MKGEKMEYFDYLKKPTIVQVAEENTEDKLNFENKDSAENRELAHQDLKAAKTLAAASKATANEDISTKKALNRKAKQSAMEATEHAQKAITYADEKHKKISNPKTHSQLETTHNNTFMQREQKKAGINILDEDDIKKLNSAIKKKNGQKSPYNAVRFNVQDIDDKSVQDSIEVADKAVKNLEREVKRSKETSIQLGNINVSFDIY